MYTYKNTQTRVLSSNLISAPCCHSKNRKNPKKKIHTKVSGLFVMSSFALNISLWLWRLPEIPDSPGFQKTDSCCVHKQLTVSKLGEGWGEHNTNRSSFRPFVFENSVSGKDMGFVLSKVPSHAFLQPKLRRMGSVTSPRRMDRQRVAARLLETRAE